MVGGSRGVDLELDGLSAVDADISGETLNGVATRAADVPLAGGIAGQTVLRDNVVRRRTTGRRGVQAGGADLARANKLPLLSNRASRISVMRQAPRPNPVNSQGV